MKLFGQGETYEMMHTLFVPPFALNFSITKIYHHMLLWEWEHV
uniref:Uncharacterized protein n=1 Tax=Arundo donax TaxID=35708 RepID=A0A0A9BWZ9_ARUDO